MIKLKDIVSNLLLSESLNSARTKYLDTKKVDTFAFNSLKGIDPTPTFKYLEKMIEFFLSEQTTLLELKQKIKLFHTLSERNQIQPKDISLYKTWKDFESTVDAANSKYMEKQVQKLKSKDAEVIVNSEDLLVVIPRTHEASCTYGAGTKWCTASSDPEHFNNYTRNSQVTLYYIIQKKETIDNRFYKMAVAVYPTEDQVYGYEKECFDALDNPIDFETILEKTELDDWIFEPKPKVLTSYEDFNLDPERITKNNDGSISYWSPVYLNAMSLNKIPFKFHKVDRDFDCKDNLLRTLENAPQIVEGSFLCQSNNLESLKGGPDRVGRSFNCSENGLRTLEYGPSKVGWEYNCSYNYITSLKGIPNELVILNARHNALTSLAGLGYVSLHLNLNNNELTSLKGCPESLDGSFHCSVNKLTSLEGGPTEVGLDYICSWNKLTSLKGAPKVVGGVFDCRGNPELSDAEKEWAKQNIEAREFRF